MPGKITVSWMEMKKQKQQKKQDKGVRKVCDVRLKNSTIEGKIVEEEKRCDYVNEIGWTRQKVRKFDPLQFSADREVGASGQSHMAQPYVPAGSSFAEVAGAAPRLHFDKTRTVVWRLDRKYHDRRGANGSVYVCERIWDGNGLLTGKVEDNHTGELKCIWWYV